VTRWASRRSDIRGLALVGSHASNRARPDSDLDLLLLATEPKRYLEDTSWVSAFGASVFWLRRLAALGGEEEAVAHWQIKRNGERRGIIEIVQEKP